MGSQFDLEILREKIAGLIRDALARGQAEGSIPAELPEYEVTIELPRRSEFGDLACNVAFRLAGKLRMPPRKLAEKIAAWIELDPEGELDRVEAAGGGFLNFLLKKRVWGSVLGRIQKERGAYGDSSLGAGQRVMIEFVSANPTGPLHVGHGRGAAVGDSLANLLSVSGFQVWKEYYINNVGRQINLLGQSVLSRFQERFYPGSGLDKIINGMPVVEFPADGYQGSYILDLARNLANQPADFWPRSLSPERAREEWVRAIGIYAGQSVLQGIKDDLERFGVVFDRWVSEEEIYRSGKVDQVLAELEKKDYLEKREGATWFKSREAFGDDKDRVLIRSTGEKTYFASDIAYHQEKFARGFDRIVNIWGSDHHGYIPRVRAAIQALGYPAENLKVILIQFVNLLRAGKPVSMSTRSGEFITLAELVAEVGRDAARFFFLFRKADSHLDFDLELAKKQAPENPVYYVQYAHARVASIREEARRMGISFPFPEWDLGLLTLPEEQVLLRQMAWFPNLVRESARALEPHHLTAYLLELAGNFHRYYHDHRVLPPQKKEVQRSGEGQRSKVEGQSQNDRGEKDLEPEKISNQDERERNFEPGELKLTYARLALCDSIQVVIKKGLDILGIQAPEKM